MIRRLLPWLFWALLAFTFVMATLPHPPQPLGPVNDKVQHILAFTTLSAVAGLAFPRTPLWRVGVGLSGYGALIEFVQMIPVLHRDAELADWAADTAAVILVLLAVLLLRRMWPASVES